MVDGSEDVRHSEKRLSGKGCVIGSCCVRYIRMRTFEVGEEVDNIFTESRDDDIWR